jgi:predicted Zn-dependent protease
MKLTTLFILTAFISFGQTLKDAIRKTDNERFYDALNDFNALIAREPNIGDNYFYFGQYYMVKGEIDSAKMIWAKGFQMDNLSPLSLVGNGCAMYLNGNADGAKLEFEKALLATKSKKDNLKNAEVRRGIATIYIKSEKKNLDEAITLLNEAILKEPNNEENYLLLGDAQYEKTPNNASNAIKSYNKVLEINPKSPRGIVRVAIIYQRAQSPDEAQKKYNEAKLVDSTYAPAYRENAELNMKFNQPKKAIENWKKYLKLNNSIEARYRYASAMFLGKQYCEVIDEINYLNANGFKNFYTDRMLGYSYVECTTDPEGYKKGLVAMDQFFANAPADKIQWLDIKNKGILYSKTGSDSLAILEFEKASKLNSELAKELSGDIAKMYFKAKKYDKAIEYYTFKSQSTKLSPAEEFELGKAYYFGPKNYVLADTAFLHVNKLSPSYAPGYWWRARTLLQQDLNNEKWLAQPSYEKVLELVKPEERGSNANKKMVMESAKYCGDYYVSSTAKNPDKAKQYWQIVLDLDPADAQAKGFFKIK